MKINQTVKLWIFYNTNIFKISAGFSSKLKPYNSLNLALCRACLYDNFFACQLYFEKPSGNENIDLFEYIYEAILCVSHYVFIGLARGVSVFNFALSRRFVFLVDFCYKTPARIKLRRLDVTFLAVVFVGGEIAFWLGSDIHVARMELFPQNCGNVTRMNGNQSTFQYLNFPYQQQLDNQ